MALQQDFSKGAELWSDNSNIPRMVVTFDHGLNENASPGVGECSQGFNFTLNATQASFIPRQPFDLAGTATNAGNSTGILQLIKRDNTETTLTVNGNTVYLWNGASTFTSKGTVTAPAYLRDAYWSLGDYSVISDVQLNNVVKKWDGTTFGDLTTGLGSTFSAKYCVEHLNRMWFFNIKSGSSLLPHMIVASKFEDPTVLDTSNRGGPTSLGGGTFSTGLEAFFLLVPDLKPINGVTVFANQLIISTDRGRLWLLQGTSSKDFQFVDFQDHSPAIGTEAITQIGNDVIFVRQGGAIALLSATQAYGNVFVSDLSRWIPTTTNNLNTINQIVYDVLNQRVYLFIPNKVLVLFKDLLNQERSRVEGGTSPWGVYTTNDSSGFNTVAAKYMWIPGTQNYSVFFGDSVGRWFNMNGGGIGDAGSSLIPFLRRSRHIGVETTNPWPWTQENITGHIVYRRLTPMDVSVTLDWDDEYNTATNVVSLKGPPAGDMAAYYNTNIFYNLSSFYNAGFSFANRVSSINLDPGGKGPGFYLSLSGTYGQSSILPQIDSIEFD
jgi:hypothetical protein